MGESDAQVHMEIGSRLENVELVQIAVQACLQKLELEEETADCIGIAVREAVANAIQHGNSGDPEKTVRVDLDLEGRDVVIQVTDEGKGFDPESLPDPLASENLLRPTGRGIFLMKRYLDEIDYEFKPGVGTVLTLRKRLPAGPTDATQQEEE